MGRSSWHRSHGERAEEVRGPGAAKRNLERKENFERILHKTIEYAGGDMNVHRFDWLARHSYSHTNKDQMTRY
jgi:hypothetical protein